MTKHRNTNAGINLQKLRLQVMQDKQPFPIDTRGLNREQKRMIEKNRKDLRS